MSGLCAGRTIGGGRVWGRRHRGVKGGRVAEWVRVREVSNQEGTRAAAQRRRIKQLALSRPHDHDLPFSTCSLAKLADFLVAEGWSMTSATRAYAPR
jgi:hypothetical protein